MMKGLLLKKINEIIKTENHDKCNVEEQSKKEVKNIYTLAHLKRHKIL